MQATVLGLHDEVMRLNTAVRAGVRRWAVVAALTCVGCSMSGALGCSRSLRSDGSSGGASPGSSNVPLASVSSEAASASSLPPWVGVPTAGASDADPADAADLRTPAQIRAFVADHLRHIDGMPPKCEMHWLGPHAKAIAALGKRAAPYLVEKLTDTTQTKWGDCNHYYVIGDFADELLHFLYDCEGPDDIPCDSDSADAFLPCQARSDCLRRPGQRARLQASWARFVARDGG